MSVTIITKGKGKGQWMPIIHNEYSDNPRRSAVVRCPTCNKLMSLVNHSISPEGMVEPSIGHPLEYPACSWHPYPTKLVGWSEDPLKLSPLPKHKCDRCPRESRLISGWGSGWGFSLICDVCIHELNPKF